MDDIFGVIYGAMTTSEQLKMAVTNNNVVELERLVDDVNTDINQILQKQGGNTALHIACINGNYYCVELILKSKRASANLINKFNLTPLDCALRTGHSKCAELLLQQVYWPIDYLWQRCLENVRPEHVQHVPEIVSFLIKGTPNHRMTDYIKQIQKAHFQYHFSQAIIEKILQVLVWTGNTLDADEGRTLQNLAGRDFEDWYKKFRNEPQKLQHYSRVIVRRNISENLFYQTQLLPLPAKVMDFLIYREF